MSNATSTTGEVPASASVDPEVLQFRAQFDDKSPRLEAAPELAIGDGALGFWAALRKVFPKTHEQRCWVDSKEAS